MIDIPDDAIDAAEKVWLEALRSKAQMPREHIEELLTAAAPIIRADERQRIAEEIRAAKAASTPLPYGGATGMEAAAQIAERSGK